MNYDSIYLISMMRGGTHAIMFWISEQLVDAGHDLSILNDLTYLASDEKMSRVVFKERFLAEQKTIVAGIEDMAFDEAVCRIDTLVSATPLRPGKVVLALRDPFNLFASRLLNRDVSLKFKAGRATRQAIAFWVEHAKTYLKADVLEIETVNFNMWFSSRNYRQGWTETVLQVPFTDSGLDYVSDSGGGSSFDGERFNGNAQQMGVLDRWKMVPDQWYQSNFPPEMFELSKEIFGFCPVEAG